jgi:hypothetical protein
LDLDERTPEGGIDATWERMKLLGYQISGLSDSDILGFLRLCEFQETHLSGGFREEREFVAAWPLARSEFVDRPFRFWSEQFVAKPDKLFLRHLEMHAGIEGARIACAVYLYRLEHDGKLPASLEELVPDYVDAVAIEPVSGKLFELTGTASGFELGGSAPVFTVTVFEP